MLFDYRTLDSFVLWYAAHTLPYRFSHVCHCWPVSPWSSSYQTFFATAYFHRLRTSFEYPRLAAHCTSVQFDLHRMNIWLPNTQSYRLVCCQSVSVASNFADAHFFERQSIVQLNGNGRGPQTRLAVETLSDSAVRNSCKQNLSEGQRTLKSSSVDELWDRTNQATHLAANIT